MFRSVQGPAQARSRVQARRAWRRSHGDWGGLGGVLDWLYQVPDGGGQIGGDA